ncbi:MAG: cytochrome P450 [Pyrinomonadaceae bacterium]
MSDSFTKSASIPPKATGAFIGGHFLKFRHNPTKFLTELAAKGDVTTFRMFDQKIFLLTNPEYVRDVLTTSNSKFEKGRALRRAKIVLGEGLLTSEGDEHLRRRRMIQPAFHRQKIEIYSRAMIEVVCKLRDSWKAGNVYDIDREMMRLTLQIVGKTLFSIDVESDTEEVGKAMTDLIASFNFLLIPYSELIERLPLKAARRSKNAREKLDSIIYKYIVERRNSGVAKDDLLSMLIAAQDEDTGSEMTDKQVHDEALTLFIAGHETTAVALTYVWYLLSTNASAAEKLFNELDEVLENREPGFEDLPKLKYTEAVFAETLRLFPPAWAFSRLCTAPHSFAGFEVIEGNAVMLSPYVTHRDKRFWTHADEFLPERWFKKSVKEAGQEFIYFPFSRGVRSCIGEGFAWTEGILTIAAIARKLKLEFLPNQKFALDPLVTLRPKYSVKMRITNRQK